MRARLLERSSDFVAADFEDERALVIADRDVVGLFWVDVKRPALLEVVVEGLARLVVVGVPEDHEAVFGAGEDEGQVWVEEDGGDGLGVLVQREDALALLVVPDLDRVVVRARQQQVARLVEVQSVHSRGVLFQRDVRVLAVHVPQFHSPVETRGTEYVRVFRRKFDPHDKLRVFREGFDLFELSFRVVGPQVDRIIVGGGHQVRGRVVRVDRADEIFVGLGEKRIQPRHRFSPWCCS